MVRQKRYTSNRIAMPVTKTPRQCPFGRTMTTWSTLQTSICRGKSHRTLCFQSSSNVTRSLLSSINYSSRWKRAIAQALTVKLMALLFIPWTTTKTRWLLRTTSSRKITLYLSRTKRRAGRTINRFRAIWTRISLRPWWCITICNSRRSRTRSSGHLR